MDTKWFHRKSLGSSQEGKCEIVRNKGRKLGGWEDGSICKTLATGMPGFSSQHCVKAVCDNHAYDPLERQLEGSRETISFLAQ